ncbi:MAG: hypothetical protein NTY05_13790 [Rhodocyclales bacterium]|nr:hypothetical protein [Rhodocyclales bacterium]
MRKLHAKWVTLTSWYQDGMTSFRRRIVIADFQHRQQGAEMLRFALRVVMATCGQEDPFDGKNNWAASD